MKKLSFILALICFTTTNSCDTIAKIILSQELSSNDLPNDRATLGECLPEEDETNEEYKPKSSVYQKYRSMEKLDNGKLIPNTLAGLFLHTFNRFQNGALPANEMERSIFQKYESLPKSTQESFACSVNDFNKLAPNAQREFIPADFLLEESLSVQQVQKLFAEEVIARASNSIFNNIECLENESPGLKRDVSEFQGNDDVGFSRFKPIIYKINGLRTAHHLPKPQAPTLRNEELEMKCTFIQQDGSLVQDCSLQTDECTGNSIFVSGTNICLAVPRIAAGESIILEGVNFFSSDGMVQLRSKENADFSRLVQAHVCGDNDSTDETEVEGVADKLLFTVPENFPSGVYSLKVLMPAELNGQEWDISESIFIEVTSASQQNYSIATEKLIANNETNPEWPGSDEVGIKIMTVRFNTDLSVANNGHSNLPLIEFGNVDSGDERDMARLLYDSNNYAVAVGIIGYEIDSRKAFEEEIGSFSEAFMDIVSDLKEILLGFGAIPIYEIFTSNSANPAFWIAAGISAALVTAVISGVAFWMPADLIIEDTLVFSTYDLGRLTSLNGQAFPSNHTAPGGTKVNVKPKEKTINQYKEERTYSGDDSKYTIRFRFNKTN